MDPKDPGFVEQVGQLVDLVRDMRRGDLGRHPFAKGALVSEMIRADLGPELLVDRDSLPETYLGWLVYNAVVEAIKSLKPKTARSLEDPLWQQYIFFELHVLERYHRESVEQELGVGRTKFYQIKDRAVIELTLELYQRNKQAADRILRTPNNLPKPLYPVFVPRYDTKSQSFYHEWILRDLLGKPGRIVSLIGPPGIGKTALAYKIAEDCVRQGALDAVIWISAKRASFSELRLRSRRMPHATSSFDELLDTIGKELGYRDILNRSTDEKLALVSGQLLRENRCLLVIDELEGLTKEAREQVEDFLADIPRWSRALVTSRRKLLAPEKPVFLGRMLRTEAFELIDRAAEEAGMSASLTDSEKDILYGAMQGSPLFLRTAIGRMKLYGYTVEEIRDSSLDQDLIDYLHDTIFEQDLETRQQELLVTLSLFAKTASLSALAAATGQSRRVLEMGLETLRDLALIRAMGIDGDADSASVMRYELLAATRDLVEDALLERRQLHIGGEPVETFLERGYEALARYYVQTLMAQNHIDDLIDFQAHERENVLRVMDWCYEHARWQYVVDLMSFMGHPLGVLGYLEERIERGLQAMEACDHLGNEGLKARFEVYDVAWSYMRRGGTDVSKAEEIHLRLLPKGREEGWLDIEALILRHQGTLARDSGRYQEGTQLLVSSRDIWQQLGLESWVVSTKASLGRLKLEMGDYEGCDAILGDLDPGKVGHRGERAEAWADRALAAWHLGDRARARQHLEEAEGEIKLVAQPAAAHAHVLCRRAEIELYQGEADSALKRLEQVLMDYDRLGWQQSARASHARLLMDQAMRSAKESTSSR